MRIEFKPTSSIYLQIYPRAQNNYPCTPHIQVIHHNHEYTPCHYLSPHFLSNCLAWLCLLDLFHFTSPPSMVSHMVSILDMTAKLITKKLLKAYVCYHTSPGFTLSVLFFSIRQNKGIADYAIKYTQNINTDLVPHQ